MATRVALFGGSFDPPHRGHLAAATAAADTFALDKILFAPTGLQPLKPAGPTAAFADRLAMVERLCAADKRFAATTIDAPIEGHNKPNYAIDTLRRLKESLPQDTQCFAIVGADSFLDLRRWRQPEDLLAAAEWIVVSRPGFHLDQLASLALSAEQREHVHLLEGVDVPVSATAVRQCLQSGAECGSLLTPEVYSYIREHHLYTPPKQ